MDSILDSNNIIGQLPASPVSLLPLFMTIVFNDSLYSMFMEAIREKNFPGFAMPARVDRPSECFAAERTFPVILLCYWTSREFQGNGSATKYRIPSCIIKSKSVMLVRPCPSKKYFIPVSRSPQLFGPGLSSLLSPLSPLFSILSLYPTWFFSFFSVLEAKREKCPVVNPLRWEVGRAWILLNTVFFELLFYSSLDAIRLRGALTRTRTGGPEDRDDFSFFIPFSFPSHSIDFHVKVKSAPIIS